MLARLLLLLALLCSLPARAQDFLPPEAAFRFSARMLDSDHVAVTFDIADGYYMYRERFKFSATDATLGQPQLPPGKVKFDQTFQKNVESYRQQLTVTLPVQAAGPFTLQVTSQGCADQGLCYSPMDSVTELTGGGAPPAMAEGRIGAALQGGRLMVIVPLFLLLGLGLAFTPCVLPMVPILSSIIVGQGPGARGLLLSMAYALGMALVYTALGIAAGLAGEGLAASLQQPWVLAVFGTLLVALALSLFGLYELQVPAAVQGKLASASNRQSRGKLAGVFAMGAISALIVGPCVAAPLAGALVYISQTRDVLLGGAALFSLAVGMSVPLLLVGVSAGTLLPRVGAWMAGVKTLFGVLLLAMAWWTVTPLMPGAVQMLGWAALGLAYGLYLLAYGQRRATHGMALVVIALGALQLAGVASGGSDALAPLAHLGGGKQTQPLHFQRIHSVEQLDAALARSQGKPLLLDFYADWCVACREMEKWTFTAPPVQQQLAGTVLLQVDVSANSAQDKALLRRFGLFGPPAIILFDGRGREIVGARVIGYQDAGKFRQSLAALD